MHGSGCEGVLCVHGSGCEGVLCVHGSGCEGVLYVHGSGCCLCMWGLLFLLEFCVLVLQEFLSPSETHVGPTQSASSTS